MEPTTIFIAAGAMALGAGASALVGRARGREVAPSAPAPPSEPQETRRLDELARENERLRALLGASPSERRSRRHTDHIEGFDAALRELRSSKHLHAAVVTTPEGFVLAGRGGERERSALAGLAAALSSHGASLSSLRWCDTLSNHLSARRVELAGGARAVLAIWSQGEPASAALVSRAMLCMGATTHTSREASSKLRRLSEHAPGALSDITRSMDVSFVALTREPGEVVFSAGDATSAWSQSTLGPLWRWAGAFGRARRELGLSDVDALGVSSGRGEPTTWLHQVGPDAFLSVTPTAHTLAPSPRMEGWLGQLRWDVSRASEAPPSGPYKATLPAPETHPRRANP